MFNVNKLRLSKSEVFLAVSNLMESQSYFLTKRLGRKINYLYAENWSINVSDYVYHYNDENGDYIRIGQSGLKEQSLLFGRKYVNVVDYLRMVLNVYHEGQHAIQCNEFFNTDSSLAQVQAIEDIAGYNNPEYYLCNGNYQINFNEIDAEYNGFLALKTYLSEILSEDIANKAVVNLINQKIIDSNGKYFIENQGGQFSMDEENIIGKIENAFVDAYAESFNAWKTYNLDGPIPDMLLEMGIDKPDEFKEYVKTDKKARIVYENARTREEQDLVVAAINCKLHPEYRHYFKCLDDVDLSYEHIIEERYAVLVNEGKAEPDKIYGRKYREIQNRIFGDNIKETSKQCDSQAMKKIRPKLSNGRELPYVDYSNEDDSYDFDNS